MVNNIKKFYYHTINTKTHQNSFKYKSSHRFKNHGKLTRVPTVLHMHTHTNRQ